MFHLTLTRHLGTSIRLLTKLKRCTIQSQCFSLSTIGTKGYTTKRTEESNTKSKFNESDINFSTLDPDKFGDLSEQYSDASFHRSLKSENAKDDLDGYDKLEIKRDVKKSIEAYMRIMNELRREKPPKVAKMLEMHRQFIYEDRYIPDKLMYSLLIDACAQVGYTKKAMELYDEMRRYELKPTKSTVTALINACANCSHTTQYGLQQVLKLREKLQLDGYEFNDIQYNVLIKAFSRLGDMATANATLKEMTSKGHTASLETYSMLLMGCINNRIEGLSDATKLMLQLMQRNSRLDLPIVNLFLRCIRDCQIDSKSLLLLSSPQSPVPKQVEASVAMMEKLSSQAEAKTQLMPQASVGDDQIGTENIDLACLPNLLTGSNLDRIVSIDYTSLWRPRNRFLLFGGVQGFIELMNSHDIKPNLKTITLFIDLMPTKHCLTEVRHLLDQYHLKADIYLYNVLLKKVAKSGNHALCRKIIAMMQNELIQPDIMTFGALTFACTDANRAKRLLSDMFKCGISPNDKIIGSLVNIACARQDLAYVLFLLNHMERNQLSLSRIDLEQIDLLLKKTRQEIADNERRDVAIGADFKKSYEQVAFRFRGMLKSSHVELNAHPWSQYEAVPRTSHKAKYNSFVRAMKAKNDIKMRRQKPEPVDYNDEIDD